MLRIFVFLSQVNTESSCFEKTIEKSKLCQIQFFTDMVDSSGSKCQNHFGNMGRCLKGIYLKNYI